MAEMADNRVDGPAAFERVAAQLSYPMLIATTKAGDELSGCLVGFATQVSLDPVRFLVCLSHRNHTYRVAGAANRLVVHYVAVDKVALARLFGEHSGDSVDKFAACEWSIGVGGAPVLAAAEAWFAGPVVDTVPFGDHTGFVIEPDSGSAGERMADLLSFPDVHDFEPGHRA